MEAGAPGRAAAEASTITPPPGQISALLGKPAAGGCLRFAAPATSAGLQFAWLEGLAAIHCQPSSGFAHHLFL